MLDALQLAREMAEEAGQPAESAWKFGDQPVLLRHHGWYSYGYWLTCESFDFMISRQEKLPAIFVQLRQAYLYEVGDAAECYRRVLEWIRQWFLPEVEKVTISRLDLCADIIGFRERDLDPTRYTSRAREFRTRGESGRITGLEWGVRGAAVFARLYDKVLEAYVHRKTWMDRLWLPHGWDPGERESVHDRMTGEVKRNKDGSVRERWKRRPESVMRLEFELRGEFLDRFSRSGETVPLKKPEDVLANAGHLWEYLTGRWQTNPDRSKTWIGWLVLREPSAGANKSRWGPPEWWQRMAAGGLHQARIDSVVRRQQGLIDAEQLLRQAAGCVAQRAAILGDTTLIEAAQEFAREWQRLLEDKGTTFEQVRAAKAERYGARLRPLEKRAESGAIREAEGGTANVGCHGDAGSVER